MIANPPQMSKDKVCLTYKKYGFGICASSRYAGRTSDAQKQAGLLASAVAIPSPEAGSASTTDGILDEAAPILFSH